MKKSAFFLLLPVLLFCVSCQDNPNIIGPESGALSTAIGQLSDGSDEAVAFGTPGVSDLSELRESYLSNPYLTQEEIENSGDLWDNISQGEAINLRDYEIDALPPGYISDEEYSYLTMVHDGQTFYFAFPKGLCGYFISDERYYGEGGGGGFYCSKE